MPRGFLGAAVLFVLSVSSLGAAIWPAQLGPHKLVNSAPLEVSASRAVWDELGFLAAERADYGSFKASTFQFKDATGAYAASLESTAGSRVGNYLVACEGRCPSEFLKLATASLPHVSRGSVPSLSEYLPRRNQIPRSLRYVIGPVGLQASAPQIPAMAAAFDFGTEAALARYQTGLALAVFSYPTPALARQQLAVFQKLTDVTAKRSGPLVVAVVGPQGTTAEALLKQVNYAGVVESNEAPPPPGLVVTPQTAGQMLLAIISLAGVVLGFCLLSGIAFGGMLMLARRFGYSAAEGSLITLHLSDK